MTHPRTEESEEYKIAEYLLIKFNDGQAHSDNRADLIEALIDAKERERTRIVGIVRGMKKPVNEVRHKGATVTFTTNETEAKNFYYNDALLDISEAIDAPQKT